MQKPKPVILLSHERSGSHLLGECISSMAGCDVVDEVCNVHSIDSLNDPLSFRRFQFDWAAAHRKEFLKPDYADRLSFISQYFDFVHEWRGRPSSIAIQIKYGHLHNFDFFYWHPIFERPTLFDWMQQNGAKLIHLRRRNVVEAAVSTEVAEQRKVWHSYELKQEAKADVSYKVDVSKVIRNASLLLEQIRWISSNWTGNIKAMDIVYEDFVRSLYGDRIILAQLAEFVGADLDDRWAPSLKKLGRPLRESLVNFSELKAACEAAGLERFV